VHFRYRTRSTWKRRQSLNYADKTSSKGREGRAPSVCKQKPVQKRYQYLCYFQSNPAKAKLTELRSSEDALLEAWRAPANATKFQPAVLRHWGSLARALAQRWRGRTPPPFLREVVDVARAAASKRRVLLISEARSGSSLVGQAVFDARHDFTYTFEPCHSREGARGDGTFFGRDCMRWAMKVLDCGMSLSEWKVLQRNRGFMRRSSAFVSIERLSMGPEGLYLRWLTQCWNTHRAAKVIRISDPGFVRVVPRDASFKVLHLLRSPEEVVASRLTLKAFAHSRYFNAGGGRHGVVAAVCRSMSAMIKAGQGLPPTVYRILTYRALAETPHKVLPGLYSWMGLGAAVPASVKSFAHQCVLGARSTKPKGQLSRGRRLLSFGSAKMAPHYQDDSERYSTCSSSHDGKGNESNAHRTLTKLLRDDVKRTCSVSTLQLATTGTV
jgi:hypothetical protein